MSVATDPQVQSLKITTLSTMLTDLRGIGEWGYAALVEVDDNKILFDTGARPETVLTNARELGVDLSEVEIAVLSHNHTDHTGGLLSLRRSVMQRNPNALARTYAAEGIFLPRTEPKNFSADMAKLRSEYEALGGVIIVLDRPQEILPGVWLTGPVPRVNPERNWNPSGRLLRDGSAQPDDIPEDQSLVIDTPRGLVVLSGCGHAGLINISDYARQVVRETDVTAVIGGFHLLAANKEHLDWTGRRLKSLGLEDFVGAHCTGIQSVYSLRNTLQLDRQHAVVGAVGSVYELGKGIDAGRLAK